MTDRKYYTPEPPHFKCVQCDDKFETEFHTPEHDSDGEEVCEFCATEDFDRCDNCGVIWYKDDGHKTCPDCGEELGGE